ncbi:MAG TPA: hypothetical protein VNU24_01855 [Solirubrobacteraceae bacterium]|nr:hypothetical protein [Solirubrobacteraceae bacterium]
MRTVAAIERHVVSRLAELSGRDTLELLRELRLADRALPVEAEQLRRILPALEADFGVPLREEARLTPYLSYARDFAVVVHKRMMVAAHAGADGDPKGQEIVELVARRLGRAA